MFHQLKAQALGKKGFKKGNTQKKKRRSNQRTVRAKQRMRTK